MVTERPHPPLSQRKPQWVPGDGAKLIHKQNSHISISLFNHIPSKISPAPHLIQIEIVSGSPSRACERNKLGSYRKKGRWAPNATRNPGKKSYLSAGLKRWSA
jgi:hypothetical protein